MTKIKLQKLSLADQIYEYLKKDIVLNKYESGEKITIKQIQDEYGVSSTPAREALHKLNRDGLVEVATNQGAKIIEFTLENSLNIHELNEVLDCYALEYAMENANRKELLSKLEETFEISLMQHNDGEIHKLYYNNYFHNVFFEFVENKIFIELKEIYKASFSMVVMKAHFEKDFYDSQEEHKEVYEAIKADDKELALKLFKAHFSKGKQKLIQYYNKNE